MKRNVLINSFRFRSANDREVNETDERLVSNRLSNFGARYFIRSGHREGDLIDRLIELESFVFHFAFNYSGGTR